MNNIFEKLWNRTERSTGCWLWTGAKSRGYGVVWLNGKPIKAHRLSWILTNGEIPENMMVCHKCDNPACIKPDHLFLGTCLDNVRDCVAKGRKACGERSGSAKLNRASVKEIRMMHEDGKIIREIASLFGISSTQTSDVIKGKYWASA